MFMIMVIRFFNLSLNFFKITFGIEFGPTAFLVLILPITLMVSFSLTGCSNKEDNFFFQIVLEVLIGFRCVLINILCYCFKEIIELISIFLLFVVNLSSIFRKVGCTLLCFFYENDVFYSFPDFD